MSTIVRILIMLLLKATFVILQDAKTHDITVNISGLDSEEGKVLIGLYDSEDKFLSKRFKNAIGTISEDKSTIAFKDVPNGSVPSFFKKVISFNFLLL